ncbi:hypothetical protein [Halodesulfovibrio sp.]|jgi:hypothetical protein|uniref:hypothetical protein n=1 Tax=Halodesulfovibrio sp. TaxID=1912772 RepID=UPI0025D9690F|nr:hypothetical protein [Halodesulfovibrio sp.]MCT4626534.1 hypothetical protein [Halodesulfovibrio sp.]
MNKESMCETQLCISYTDFVDGAQNSLTWYDIMPGDAVQISGDPDPRTAAQVAAELLSSGNLEQEEQIDLIALKIMNGCASIPEFENWAELAFRMSEVMSNHLTPSGKRSIRMRAQRLNFYLQMIIDRDLPASLTEGVVAETILKGNKPWDYMQCADGFWWVTSDDKNVHYRANDGTEQHWRLGLPTQIDIQHDGRVAVGSFYTPGAWLGDGGEWEFLEHEQPVILVFAYKGKTFFLDYTGKLWEEESRRLVAQDIVPQVHFARYFDGVIYVIDNNKFGCVTSFSLDTERVEHHSVLPVLVCNDLVACESGFYLIDKQQGSVFKFDTNWNYKERMLRFGVERGCLQDPVALRLYDDHLYVVSWLTAHLTELKKF